MEKLNQFIEKARATEVDPIEIDIFVSDLYDDSKTIEENLQAFDSFTQ